MFVNGDCVCFWIGLWTNSARFFGWSRFLDGDRPTSKSLIDFFSQLFLNDSINVDFFVEI